MVRKKRKKTRLNKQKFDLFDDGFDWQDEWKDMPEFEHKELRSKRKIVIHFRNDEDVEKFAKLINQSIILGETYTKSLWYPHMPDKHFSHLRYVDKNES